MSRKTYTTEFKDQIYKLYKSGKPSSEIIKEYSISAPTFYSWIKQFDNNGVFNQNNSPTDLQKENIKLRQDLKDARMEVDILKQAALIMGQKRK